MENMKSRVSMVLDNQWVPINGLYTMHHVNKRLLGVMGTYVAGRPVRPAV